MRSLITRQSSTDSHPIHQAKRNHEKTHVGVHVGPPQFGICYLPCPNNRLSVILVVPDDNYPYGFLFLKSISICLSLTIGISKEPEEKHFAHGAGRRYFSPIRQHQPQLFGPSVSGSSGDVFAGRCGHGTSGCATSRAELQASLAHNLH